MIRYAEPRMSVEIGERVKQSSGQSSQQDLNLLLQKKGSTGAGLILRKEAEVLKNFYPSAWENYIPND